MYKSCELHLPSVKCKYLCCIILLWKTGLIHYILLHCSALQTTIKCTADHCGHLSSKETFYWTYPGADVGNCACFIDSEKAWQIFTRFLCNAKANRRESELILFYLNILSCTVLCDPDLLQLLNPCLILIVRVIPFTLILKCLHKLRLQFRLRNHYYWSSTIRRSRKKNVIKIRRFNLGLNKTQKYFLSFCTNSTTLFTVLLFKAELYLFVLSSCRFLFLYYPPIHKAFHS